jgi:hypothetical protein
MDYSRICGAGRRAKCSLEKKERAFMSETEQKDIVPTKEVRKERSSRCLLMLPLQGRDTQKV